jgi:predicted lipoprotein with Yx(FWY)xxD motif
MFRTRPALSAAVALALLVAACGSSGDDSTSAAAGATTAPAAGATTTATPATTATSQTTGSATTATARSFPLAPGRLTLATTDLGDIVVDGEGNTIYLFLPDKQSESTCYDRCEQAWPVVGAADGVADGLDASLLATVTRKNGAIQATYNGWPLYYFAGDKAPGDSNGQTLNEAWYVIDAAGDGIS